MRGALSSDRRVSHDFLHRRTLRPHRPAWASVSPTGCIGIRRANRSSRKARAPSRDELQGLLLKIIARLMNMLTRQGCLVEEQGMTYLTDIGPDHPLTALQAASCTYRIALGLRAGQKVLSLRTVSGRDKKKRRGTMRRGAWVTAWMRNCIEPGVRSWPLKYLVGIPLPLKIQISVSLLANHLRHGGNRSPAT